MAVIRVSGDHGSGKTTLCKRLAKELGYEYHYTGGVFRRLAQERNLSIEEFYAQMVANPELEKSIDAEQERLMLERDNLIMEGIIAPFLKCGFRAVNVKVTASVRTCVKRQLSRPENAGKSFGEMKRDTQKRVGDERERYLSLYGIRDHLADEHFDAVIDTTGLTKDGSFRLLMSKLKTFLLSKTS